MNATTSPAPDKIYIREPIPVAERKRVIGTTVPHEGEDGSVQPVVVPDRAVRGSSGRHHHRPRFPRWPCRHLSRADGVARIQSAYCPHIGADLSVGKVIENRVQCAFHQWEYDENGMCVKTGAGFPPPANACLYTFPVTERFGIIYVFNGHEPLWDIADFEYADDELVSSAFMSDLYTCDPWIFASNTPDTQHISVVHGFRFKADDPSKTLEWTPWGFRMKIDAWHQDDEDLAWEAGIFGTSTFIQQGMTDGWWLGIAAGFSLPRPGTHHVFISVLVRNVEIEGGKSIQERLDYGKMLLARTAAEDKPILDSIHHKVGIPDQGRYRAGQIFQFPQNYPRAHPARDFIR